MADGRHLSGFVADLYELAASCDWDGATARLADHMGRSHVIVGGYGDVRGMTRRGLAGFTTEDFEEFQTRYAEGAAIYAARLGERSGTIADHRGETPPADPGYAALAAHVRSKFGLAPEYGAILDPSPDHIELVVVAHEEERLGEDPVRAARMAEILPHLRRAYGLTRAAERRALVLGGLQAAFDRVTAGLFLCTPDGRILHMNAIALDLVAERSGLLAVSGRLRARDKAAQARLATEIAAAAERRPGGRSTLIAAPRRLSLPLLLTVASHAPGVAIVFAEDPERDLAPDLARLIRGGGLSRAQARTALLAAAGHSNHAIARRIGVSENTVKTHLSRVFDKLDCRDRRGLALRVAALRGIQK